MKFTLKLQAFCFFIHITILCHEIPQLNVCPHRVYLCEGICIDCDALLFLFLLFLFLLFLFLLFFFINSSLTQIKDSGLTQIKTSTLTPTKDSTLTPI